MLGICKRLSTKLKLPLGISITVLLILLSGSFIAGCTLNSASPTPSVQTQTSSNGEVIVPLYDETTTMSLYDRVIPGVVEIDTVLSASTSSSFLGTAPQTGGQGSGFFIDNNGHILTNNHVVEGAQSVSVVLHNGDTLDATVVGTDPQSDLAIISVDPTKVGTITTMTLGDSDSVKPGQMAIAMGSPYGLDGSITVGVISGIGRSLLSITSRTIPDMIQTDAAINPGNSGGPLLNSKGEVIGINTAIESSSSGIGFAIPINTAKAKLSALLVGGALKAAWLGVTGIAIDNTLSDTIGLTVSKGVYIIDVTAGGPAEKAGLIGSGQDNQGVPEKGGDIVTAVDGVSVAKVEDMLTYFNTKKPGDTVTLTVARDGKQISVKATLGEWPANLTNPS